MRVLIDIVHPAHVLFFLRPIRAMQARGDDLLILSREKDVTCELLDAFGLDHRPASSIGRGTLGLAFEMVSRDLAVFQAARAFGPDVMLGYGGVAISHVGRLLGIPAVAFYDSENAVLQTRLTWPFITKLYVNDAYAGEVPAGRTTHVPGIPQLSYFHPDAFAVDRAEAVRSGLDPDRPNVFVRTVSWGANHDIGKAGLTPEETLSLCEALSGDAKVHLSAEEAMPAALDPYLYRGAVEDLHHLVGACDLYVGESATIACEAITLGVPALYRGHDVPGYMAQMGELGLAQVFGPETNGAALTDAAAAALTAGPEDFAARRAAWLAACPDWGWEILAWVDEAAA